MKEAQANINWLESLTRGIAGDGLRGKIMQISFGDFYAFARKIEVAEMADPANTSQVTAPYYVTTSIFY